MRYRCVLFTLLLLPLAASAIDYRLAYSPSRQLEAFIDNVADSEVKSWCSPHINLRLVAGKPDNPQAQLNDFMPLVGGLLKKQCPTVEAIRWVLHNPQGAELAAGDARAAERWQPQFAPEAPPVVTEVPIPPPLSDPTPIPAFELPDGCRFHAWWHSGDDTLFIPATDTLECREGRAFGFATVTAGNQPPQPVTFIHGYPLMHLTAAEPPPQLVSASRERILLGAAGADTGSYLLLPFDAQHNAWVFTGTVIVEMPRQQASDARQVAARLDSARRFWQPRMTSPIPLTFLWVEQLIPDLLDPASGHYRPAALDAAPQP
ncbi:hypothetical protein [Entomohabitans teleogrylli]|uniref:hypothetical protein n=1 Tax=Entomohabitans teleogrylli TaxID=1384589 RepID=UPI00073D3377|nr:hypothetical protein [Entomohabitans teleogrylli]